MTSLQTKVFQELLDGYTLCGCCDGHDVNKPSVWDPNELMNGCVNKKPKGGCRCACRHNARALCRLHPDYKGCTFSYSDLMASPWG